MSLTRRTLLGGAPLVAAMPVLGALPAAADGHAGLPSGTGIVEASFGRYRIAALLDGVAPLGRQFFFGPDEKAIDATLAAAGIGPDVLPAPVTAYLLQSEDRTILIDAGMGAVDLLGPGFGHLTPALAALGVTPEAVDQVILTHAHPDHLGGLIADGAATFPAAQLTLAEAEAAFWTDDGILAQAPAEAQGLFRLARGVLDAYADRTERVADGAEIAPGVVLELSPGHTMGHSVLRIDGGDREMSMIADTLHSAELHTAMPDVGFGFDTDPALAAKSRRRLFDRLAADRTLVAGSHLPFPGFGRILRSGEAYRYAAATIL